MLKTDCIVNYIIENIDKNIWKPGDRISSEADIAKLMKVSRNTVREALSKLYNEGVIIKKVGSGSYVSEKYINKSDKYIIIATQKSLLKNISGFTYRTVIDLLSKKITEAGYISHIYIEQQNSDFKNIINIDSKKIAGVIDIFGNEDNYGELLKENIPIISCIRTVPTTQPSICVNIFSLFNTFVYLINKYNLRRCIILTSDIEIELCNTIENMILYTYPIYLARDENNIIYSSLDNDFNRIGELLEAKLLSLNYIPDAIIFTDDAIFAAASGSFKKLEHIFSKTKIISQYTTGRSLNLDFDYCRLEVDPENIAKETMNLLLKIINKEFIDYYNIYLNHKIINEEVLQN